MQHRKLAIIGCSRDETGNEIRTGSQFQCYVPLGLASLDDGLDTELAALGPLLFGHPVAIDKRLNLDFGVMTARLRHVFKHEDDFRARMRDVDRFAIDRPDPIVTVLAIELR